MADKEINAMTVTERLLAIQTRIKAPKAQKNIFGKYSYRSCEDILEAVKPLLDEYALTLVVSDTLELIGERYYIKAEATVYLASNYKEWVTVTGYAREAETKKGMDESQITGATSSYARKYALNGLFNIDDTKDADTNEHREQVKNTPEPPKAEIHEPTKDQLLTLKGLAMQAGYTKEESDEKLRAVTTYQIAEQSITKLREKAAQKRQQKDITNAVTPDNANG